MIIGGIGIPIPCHEWCLILSGVGGDPIWFVSRRHAATTTTTTTTTATDNIGNGIDDLDMLHVVVVG